MQDPRVEFPRRRNATIPMVRATLLSIPIAIVEMGIFIGLFRWLWGMPVLSGGGTAGLLLFLFLLLAGIVLHEGLHALGWKIAAGVSWSSIRFGVHWKALAPYAHCQVPMGALEYKIGIVLPGVILGVIPGMAGLVLGSFPIVLWGALFTAAASGDLLGLWAIRSVPSDAKVLDHPSELGCEVIEE